MSTRTEREIHVELPMEPNIEIRAGHAVAELAASAGMNPDLVDDLRMAVHEACINAAEHSRADDSTIYVTARLVGGTSPGTSEKIEVTVRDTGVGMADQEPRDSIRTRRHRPTGLPRKRGWGLTIIDGLVDEVEIESDDTGTAITMSKRIVEPGESEGP